MCIVSGDVVEPTCSYCNHLFAPCLKADVHKIWSMMPTKILKRHALVGFKPGTERAGVILFYLNLSRTIIKSMTG